MACARSKAQAEGMPPPSQNSSVGEPGMIVKQPPVLPNEEVSHMRDLIDALAKAVPPALSESPAYDNVLACFISWADATSNSDLADSFAAAGGGVDDLKALFRTQFRYDVRGVRLPSTPAAPRVFVEQVSALLRDLGSSSSSSQKGGRRNVGSGSNNNSNNNNNSLLILFYDGPSGYRAADRRGLWYDQQPAAPSGYSAAVEWDTVSSCVKEADCDVLCIFDCDFGSSVLQREAAGIRRCEVLSSPAESSSPSTSAGPKSFTRALTTLLKTSSAAAGLSSAQISWRLAAGAAIPTWTRLTKNEGLVSSILLQPLTGDKVAQLPKTSTASSSIVTQVDELAKLAGSAYVLLTVRFSNRDGCVAPERWLRWPDKPSENADLALGERLRKLVRCHCLLGGSPAVGVVSMPAWLWSCLEQSLSPTLSSSAWSLIGPCGSGDDLLQQSRPDKPPAYTEHAAGGRITTGFSSVSVTQRSTPYGTGSPTSPSKRTRSWGYSRDARTNSNMQRQFAAVLTEAQRKYAEANGRDLALFADPPMRSVADLERAVDARNDKFTKFREKRRPLFKAMSAACGPLEVVGEALSGAASETFPPAQTIFAAAMFLVNAARDVSACYDDIIDLFDRLKDFTDRLRWYVREHLYPELLEKLAQILAAVFEVLVLAATEVESGRFKSYFKKLLRQESPVSEVMKKLASLTEAEHRLVDAETNALAKRNYSDQQRLMEMVARIDQNVKTAGTETRVTVTKEQALTSNTTKLRGILRPSAYPKDAYFALKRNRTPGTGNWILEDSSIKAWFAGEIRFLWVRGNPGTGKSYLTSRLVSWGLDMLEAPETTHMMGYFFFRKSSLETRSVSQALRDMAFQISEQDVFYGKQLLHGVSSGDDVKTVASAFRHLFIEPCKPDRWKRNIYLLLDGLDEADPADLDEFLPLLADLLRQPEGGTRVQVALVGRDLLTEKVLGHLEGGVVGGIGVEESSSWVRTLHVTPERNAGDIVTFIRQGVESAPIMSRSSAEFKQQVVEAMTRQVDGLFVLAKFMLGELARMRRHSRIIESLRSFPQQINGMLEKAVLDFSASLRPEDAEDLNEILRWVATAQTRLSLEQVSCVLALHQGDAPSFLEKMLRDDYSCFFTLERADGLSTADLAERGEVDYLSNARTTYVTFFHESVREFFAGGAASSSSTGGVLRATESSPAIGFRLNDARLHVLQTCLRIFTDTESFHLGAEEGLSLQRYAAWYWQEHLEQLDLKLVPANDKAEIGRQLVRMLTEDVVVLSWTNLFEESLDIWTDDNIDCVRRWLADPDVVSGLTPEAKAWSAEAAKSAAKMIEPMGRVFARAWLKTGFVMYMPTLFCFGVVQCLALMSEGEGSLWSYSEYHWQDVALETRVAKAAEWAITAGIIVPDAETRAEKGHRYRRIGSTLLNLGLHKEALSYYEKALEADGEEAENCGRMGLCRAMSGDWAEALKLHQRALRADILAAERGGNLSSISNKSEAESFHEARAARWRRYKNLCSVAECHNRLGHVDEALQQAREAMAPEFTSEHPAFEPEAAYIRILAENGRVDDLMALVRELDSEADDSDAFDTKGGQLVPYRQPARSRLVAFLLTQIPDRAVRNWFPQAAARTDSTSLLAARYADAAAAARESQQDPWKERYIQNSLGRAYLCAGMFGDAIRVQEEICLAEDLRARGGGGLAARAEYVAAFRLLARAYALQALLSLDGTDSSGGGGGSGEGGKKEPDGGRWVQKLETLMAQQERLRGRLDAPLQLAGLEFNEASVFLILLHRLRENSTSATNSNAKAQNGNIVAAEAKEEPAWKTMTAARVRECLDLLEDDEPQNDVVAIRNLQRTLLAAGDEAGARALWQSTRQPTVALSSPTAAAAIRTPAGGSHLTSSPRPSSETDLSQQQQQQQGGHKQEGHEHHHRRNSSNGNTPSPRRRGRDLALTTVFLNGEVDIGGSTPVTCDACLRRLKPDEELAVCKLCVDARFCPACLKVVKQKKASSAAPADGGEKVLGGGFLCSATHDWMVVPPLDRELRAGQILVEGDRVTTLDEWKASLRLRWGVKAASGAHATTPSRGNEDRYDDDEGYGGGFGGVGPEHGGLGITVRWDG